MAKRDLSKVCKAGSILENSCNLSHEEAKEKYHEQNQQMQKKNLTKFGTNA